MRFTTGNLLDAEVDALVNTVNTVGVMGKGIALMFKERFPDNSRIYEQACAAGELVVGNMLVTERSDMYGPRFIINFPTKMNWRNPSQLEWIRSGLVDLRRVIQEYSISSIAIPPLGAGNGGLNWLDVRPLIVDALTPLSGVDILIYEPTAQYQNVSKRHGIQKLTPARALVAELIRQYWVLGIECTLLEVQKLAYFIEANVRRLGLPDPLKLDFKANRYGPYADGLRHLLNSMDGSYLQCDKRISDAGPFDVIRFADNKRDQVDAYFSTGEAKPYREALASTIRLIDGFQSPLGMELLATVDWLLNVEGVEANVVAIEEGVRNWAGGAGSGARKAKIFEPRLIEIALKQLAPFKSVRAH